MAGTFDRINAAIRYAKTGTAADLARYNELGGPGFRINTAAKVAAGAAATIVAGPVLASVGAAASRLGLQPVREAVFEQLQPKLAALVPGSLSSSSSSEGSPMIHDRIIGGLSRAGQVLGGIVRGGTGLTSSSPCPAGSYRVLPGGPCIDLVPGGRGSGSGVIVSPGDPRTTSGVMIGASGYVPMRSSIDVRRCARGSVLGIDGLCYDKRTLRKDQRAWPPGRKPLLTGGDLSAIAKAARAARRVKVQQRKLEQLGLLKRPKPSRGVITKAEAARALRR